MKLTPGTLPIECRRALQRAMQIEDRYKRIRAIDTARERAQHRYPELFKSEVTHMQVKLRNVRLAFPNLWTPKAFTGEPETKADYNAAFILPKDHPQLAELKAAAVAVAKEKWGDKAKEVYDLLVKTDKALVHDGDMKSNLGGYAGHYYVNARNKTAPTVIDRDRSQLNPRSGKPYSGCYVNVIIDVWAQDNNYGKRINASLGGVQFFEHGEAFSGGAPAAADDFDDLSDTGGTNTAGGEAW